MFTKSVGVPPWAFCLVCENCHPPADRKTRQSSRASGNGRGFENESKRAPKWPTSKATTQRGIMGRERGVPTSQRRWMGRKIRSDVQRADEWMMVTEANRGWKGSDLSGQRCFSLTIALCSQLADPLTGSPVPPQTRPSRESGWPH